MKRLEDIKGKEIVIPEHLKRYVCVVWTNKGWFIPNDVKLCTTPEDAIQQIYSQNFYNGVSTEYAFSECFKVVELKLENIINL